MELVRGMIVESFDINVGCLWIDLVVSPHHTDTCVFDITQKKLLKYDTTTLYAVAALQCDFFSTDGEKQ